MRVLAKYLCNYGSVKGLAADTVSEAEKMSDNTNEYDNSMNAILLGNQEMYYGKSRDALDNRLHNEDGLINGATDITEFGKDLGNHVTEAADKIEKLDQKLAQLKI